MIVQIWGSVIRWLEECVLRAKAPKDFTTTRAANGPCMLPTQTVMDESLDEWAVEEHTYDIGRAVEHVANDMEYAPCRAFKAN